MQEKKELTTFVRPKAKSSWLLSIVSCPIKKDKEIGQQAKSVDRLAKEKLKKNRK